MLEDRETQGLIAVLAIVAVIATAGCIGTDEISDDIEPAETEEVLPRLAAEPGIATGTQALVFEGARLDAGEDGSSTSSDCEPSNCEQVSLEVTVPEGYWETHTGGLEVSVAQTDSAARFQARLLDEAGQKLAESQWAFYAGTLLFEEPAPGNYTVEVVAQSGSGAYEGVFQIDARPSGNQSHEPMRPNLVTMPPLDFALEHPNPPPYDMPVGESCSPYEIVEQEARRCLRFTNTVANLGTGPVEVRLTFEEGAKAAAGMGEFVQRIYHSDGSFTDEPVAQATFHATHAHWHYENFAGFELYRYDAEADERGELVREQSKSGFCFFDMGITEMDHLGTTPPRYASEARCFTEPENDWVTGLSPGWYDMYWSSLDEQYVDVSGLEDGIYELVTTADAEGSLIQTTDEDDKAGAVIRLSGDSVEVLDRWSDGTDTWT